MNVGKDLEYSTGSYSSGGSTTAATATAAAATASTYTVLSQITSDAPLHVEFDLDQGDLVDQWDGSNFDPRNRCPDWFEKQGYKFIHAFRKAAGGVKKKIQVWIYHPTKKILHRLDTHDGWKHTHWVESTKRGARSKVMNPDAKDFGQRGPKKSPRPGQDRFHDVHNDLDCPDEWDMINKYLPW